LGLLQMHRRERDIYDNIRRLLEASAAEGSTAGECSKSLPATEG